MPMPPRERRLDSEYRELLRLAESSSLISFVSQGLPPTRYTITTTCTGFRRFGSQIVKSSEHEFELVLDENFPLQPPVVTWRTPVFHPNIRPPHVCSGDIWYPAMSLAAFCVELCELIQYRKFNVYDPLDDEAAVWLRAVLDLSDSGTAIPVDTRPIIDVDFDLGLKPRQSDDT